LSELNSAGRVSSCSWKKILAFNIGVIQAWR